MRDHLDRRSTKIIDAVKPHAHILAHGFARAYSSSSKVAGPHNASAPANNDRGMFFEELKKTLPCRHERLKPTQHCSSAPSILPGTPVTHC